MPHEFYEMVGDQLRINLHSGQTEAFDIIKNQWDTFRVLLVLAGWQSGKTIMGPSYLHYCMSRRTKEGFIGKEGEPLDYVAASATYDVLRLKMLPALESFFCHWLDWGRYSVSDRVIYSHDGSTRIILRSADSGVGLESFTAVDAWADEWGRNEVGIEKYESLMRGLSVHQGHLLITTTAWNMGWTKICIYDPAVGGSDIYKVASFPSIANPSFPKAEWERAKESMPDWKFQMRYEGKYSKPAGIIYGDYNPSYAHIDLNYIHNILRDVDITGEGHLVKPFSIPKEWHRHVGGDFGAVNSALVWLAEQPGEDRYFIYRDSMMDGRTTREYAKDALAYREGVRNWRGGAGSEDQTREDWQVQGVPFIRPHIDGVEPQIDRVISLFKQNRLYIFDTCNGVRSQLGTYSRELDGAGNPTDKIENKDEFHYLDALRYICTVFPDEAKASEREQNYREPEVDPQRSSLYY